MDIVSYMRSSNQVPIMTNSESIIQFGPNGYSKPATALNILRETILGRELFDFAFKEYAMRWKFKRPMPADFFRTMEDASGVDLDWFWRGWFYSTDHVDIAVTGVRQLNVSTGDPEVEKGIKRELRDAEPETLSMQRNKELKKRADEYPELNDFYNEFDPLDVTRSDRKAYESFLESLNDEEKELIAAKRNFYLIDFENVGGLVMPIIFDAEFKDGSTKRYIVPAEIWTRDNKKVTRMVITEKEIAKVVLDPQLETADVDLGNNHFPPAIVKSRFEVFKSSRRGGKNQMQKAQAEEKSDDEDKDEEDDTDKEEE